MNFVSKLMQFADNATTVATNAAGGQEELTGVQLFIAQYGGLIMIALVFVVMYFLMIRPPGISHRSAARPFRCRHRGA